MHWPTGIERERERLVYTVIESIWNTLSRTGPRHITPPMVSWANFNQSLEPVNLNLFLLCMFSQFSPLDNSRNQNTQHDDNSDNFYCKPLNPNQTLNKYQSRFVVLLLVKSFSHVKFRINETVHHLVVDDNKLNKIEWKKCKTSAFRSNRLIWYGHMWRSVSVWMLFTCIWNSTGAVLSFKRISR